MAAKSTISRARGTDSDRQDYPLVEVPMSARKPVGSLMFVLLGFTFFTATMFAGGQVGVAFPFWPDLVVVIVAGNALLGGYVAVLGYIACKSGLNTTLMGRMGFGDIGSRWPDLLLGVTQIGWYGWGTATIAIVLLRLFGVSEDSASYTIYSSLLMVIFGLAFCITAYIGYRGLEILSRWAVPLMVLLLVISLGLAFDEAGGWAGLNAIEPTGAMTIGTAITLVFGTFASGGTQSTNWTRFARTGKTAIWASLVAFLIGNGLMVVMGAVGALVYQQSDVVDVLVLQGLLVFGILMLFLNIWTTQDNTVYNFSAAGCTFLRTENRRLVTVCGAVAGTVLGLMRVDLYLVQFLVLLGTLIPPIGGIIIADFFYKHRGRYPVLGETHFRKFNWAGIGAYVLAILIAFLTPGVPPINGIIAAAVSYIVFDKILERAGRPQDHAPVKA